MVWLIEYDEMINLKSNYLMVPRNPNKQIMDEYTEYIKIAND